MYTENFYFLCLALNQFPHEASACVENCYRPMEEETDKVRYRSSFLELKNIFYNLLYIVFLMLV